MLGFALYGWLCAGVASFGWRVVWHELAQARKELRAARRRVYELERLTLESGTELK